MGTLADSAAARVTFLVNMPTFFPEAMFFGTFFAVWVLSSLVWNLL